jgi:hypothetical protein
MDEVQEQNSTDYNAETFRLHLQINQATTVITVAPRTVHTQAANPRRSNTCSS